MTQEFHIPFNKPYVSSNTYQYVTDVLASNHQHGGGPYNLKSAEIVEAINGGGEAFLTSSCTQALEMATILLDLQPGDEVILPSYTFPSAATSLINFGVVPVFADINNDDLNIDATEIESLITEKTKAISIVNYNGVACDFSQLDKIASKYDLFKIEDNAHGFGINSKNVKLGTWGDVSTLSFHATKNIQCGEGGALIVNNTALIERAQIIQEKGTNRKQFILGNAEKYSWKDKGGSFLLPEVLAAALYSQLEEYENIQKDRNRITRKYTEGLSEWFNQQGIQITSSNKYKKQSSHLFYFLAPSEKFREALIEFLQSRKIQASFHYLPLHDTEIAQRTCKISGYFTNTLSASTRIIRLPVWYGMSEKDIEYVIDAICEFRFDL